MKRCRGNPHPTPNSQEWRQAHPDKWAEQMRKASEGQKRFIRENPERWKEIQKKGHGVYLKRKRERFLEARKKYIEELIRNNSEKRTIERDIVEEFFNGD